MGGKCFLSCVIGALTSSSADGKEQASNDSAKQNNPSLFGTSNTVSIASLYDPGERIFRQVSPTVSGRIKRKMGNIILSLYPFFRNIT